MRANPTGALACVAALAALAGCGGSSHPAHAPAAAPPVSSAAASLSPTASATASSQNATASTATRGGRSAAASTATHSATRTTSTAAVRTTARSTASKPVARPAVGLRLQTPPGQPRAGVLWPITVTSVPPQQGVVSYEFLYNGAIVSRQPGGSMRAGVYHDKLRFPARAVGIPITLRVVLRMPSGQIVHTDHNVSVQR